MSEIVFHDYDVFPCAEKSDRVGSIGYPGSVAPAVRHTLLRRRALWVALGIAWAALLPPPAARAVLIDSGDGTGNTSAPPDDPGWDHVGRRGGFTAIYLGNGWVLTANHVPFGPVVIDGTSYSMISSTSVRLMNEDNSLADLKVVGLAGVPPLPLLPIRATMPSVSTPVIMAGHGRDRGPATSYDPYPGPPPSSMDGWEWLTTKTLRWGTNEVSGFLAFDDPLNGTLTELMDLGFEQGATTDEAMATEGDSGGAVFIDNGSQWELAGVLIAIWQWPGQPFETSIYGNVSYAADLSYYHTQIEDIVALPEPDDATSLVCGVAFLALLARRRRRA